MSLSVRLFLVLLLVLPTLPVIALNQIPQSIEWLEQGVDGEPVVNLYFFWSRKCPHCQDARPFVLQYGEKNSWLRVHDLEVTEYPENRQLFSQMAAAAGQQSLSVPTFFVCNRMLVGWDNDQGMGAMLLQTARSCLDDGLASEQTQQAQALQLELPFGIDANQLSLPLFTLVIAALDAFNPCAFFILLFLLSLLVHARSRRRMLLVGLTFVVISGVVYFLFMAAWLNLFLLIGSMPWITFAAGLLAVLIGIMNSREIFMQRSGVSLSIPDAAKPGLYHRMGRLLSVENLPALLAGTVMLAIAVNSYELLCTAGFPMVYTRALTLYRLDALSYYLYLAFYNVVYVIPLMAIVGLFTWTLGTRKLSQSEGKTLKLLSGLMMLMLGVVLMIAPEWLNNLSVGLLMVSAAIVLTALITLWHKKQGVS
jgi:hypothetical protein